MSVGFTRSVEQFERTKLHLAGGVATAFRAAQRPVPITFTHGRDALLWDADGNEYVDYVLGFGPLLLGHSPEAVLTAVEAQLRTGIGYGASHHLEAELAEAICRSVPCADQTIISNTGSEAVHAALRIARAATGRSRVIKFLGHYHGWYDPVYAGVAPQHDAAPATAGQDPAALRNLSVVSWNDPDALDDALGPDVAAIILEPLNVNGGTISPSAGYLEAAVEAAHRQGAVVIFDEVITGFRLALGGAQEFYAVTPDLTVLGKALGAGFPVSAVCGRSDLMSEVASGHVAHVGTFNAGPVCAAAAVAALREFERQQTDLYPMLAREGDLLAGAIREASETTGLPLRVNQVGGVLSVFAADAAPTSYEETLSSDGELIADFMAALLAEGVHGIPTGRFYLSSAHTDQDLHRTAEAIQRAANVLARAR